MKMVKTGLFTMAYYFTLEEKDLYKKTIEMAEKAGGSISVLFINNGYAFEHTLRTYR